MGIFRRNHENIRNRLVGLSLTSGRRLSCEHLEARLLLSANAGHALPAFDLANSAGSLSSPQQAASFVASGPVSTPPIFHSLPGAEAKVFLDFDGNWESSWGGSSNVLTPAYDTNGDPTSYTIEEQRRIHEAWSRVSEDFAPFNVDVTTEDPADAATMLRQALTVSQRTRTFYFRHRFEVESASAVSNLTLKLLRDDGAAVYLNGTEIVRDNLAPDAKYDDFASSTASNADESTLQEFVVDPDLLVNGENVLAVEVHQASDTSSDVSFDLSLEGTISDAPNVSLVELGSSWRYLDDGSDQGELWRAADFDDSAWQVDQAEFGYGDSDEATALLARPAGQGRTRTFYFRHEFEIPDPDAYTELAVGLLRDDGAAVYLNGEEIVRDNLRPNAAFDDFATSTANNDEETTFYPSVADAGLLRVGRNVIAVEVHQVSDSSSDVSFDLEMSGTNADGNMLPLVSAGAEWRYLDDGSDQGDSWREPEYDDLAWPFGVAQFGYGDAPGTVHVAIGSEDWYEDSAGGVAFVSSFDLDGRTVVYTFTNGAGTGAKSIAEVSSHEAGHAFGLSHQSVYDPETGERTIEYNPGEGDWAPIMGSSYSPGLTTWHDGPVGSQGRPQDDMSVIARRSNGFGYRDDDHGSDAATASDLLADGATSIDVAGIIERNDDQDVFSFSLAEGQGGISIQADGAPFGANLDAVLEIQDALGNVVASDDPSNSYNAKIDVELAPGAYTAIVRSNGEYGRVGQYTLTGDVDEAPTLIELAPVGPLAVASATAQLSGLVNFANDRDFFSVDAKQGDVITAIATPTAGNATLTLRVAGSDVVATGTRGGSTVFPLTSIERDGTYEIEVMGDRTTAYTLDIGVNLLFETDDTNAEDVLPINWPALAHLDSLTVLGQSEPNLEVTSLIGRASTWSYLDDGSDQGEQWRANEFDDSQWASARGEFGYGDNDERTDVREDDAVGTRNRTFYFRQHFALADLEGLNDLILELKFDDGAAVYLNGEEVVRDNLAPGAGYRDFAESTVDAEDTYRRYELDPASLQLGDNVLAIEVHQASDTSSDVSMDARLDVTRSRPAVDTYSFSVGASDVNTPLDLFLLGRSANFRDQRVEILSADDQVVLASSQESDVTTYDLRISGWTPPSEGTYLAQVVSSTVGSYVLSLRQSQALHLAGDTNFDGQVDFADFLILSGAFGTQGTWDVGDFDGDGLVGFSDFLLLSANFGK